MDGSQTQFDCTKPMTRSCGMCEQETHDARLITDIRCPKSDMLLVNYEAPDGAKRHNRLWNGGTGTGRLRLYNKVSGKLFLIDEITAASVGCEYGEYDPE